MQHEMRRKDRQIPAEEAYKLLECAEYGIMATVNSDGTPYGVPLSFVLKDNKIYFHCAAKGQKLENITANPNVSFTVVGFVEAVAETKSYSTYFESAIVFGKASIVEDNDERRNALYILTEKYLPNNMDSFEASLANGSFERTVVAAIEIEHITGKAKKKM